MEENNNVNSELLVPDIAIIGMSCRFPGANNIDEFWDNLIQSKETIYRFTQDELLSSGESAEKIANENYINARGIVEGPELFDANFFGFSASDAKILDPQQRLFFECGWEALEAAGYSSEKFDGLIGVYASMAESTYLQNNILKNKDALQSVDWLQARISTSLTTLSTQLSYRLNLKGPSINITTACSSSLVLITSACKALLDYDCDLAIAGASVISIPQQKGYLYQKGGIDSADGHCRAFDAEATGTVFSDGVGVVILKRLSEAVKDNDFIYATIKGWSINNDGAEKIGYTAPSVQGQARCILSAANFSDIDLNTISYIETHGTGTAMGDPIEINALKMAFDSQTDKKQFCAIGSVKTNIGHADIAAGMASLIKTVLSLKNKLIPASLHFNRSNPAIDFNQTPFYVNDKLAPWEPTRYPRRAGINSSGIGGTNAFLILEEHNKKTADHTAQTDAYKLLLFSAKNQASVDKTFKNILQQVENDNKLNLQNIAYTLQVGRTDFNYRRAIICRNNQELLSLQDPSCLDVPFNKKRQVSENIKIAFMFSGQGSQYIGMCNDLYQSESEFSKVIDNCLLHLDLEIKDEVCLLLLGTNQSISDFNNTLIVQPALFIFEYALGSFLINLGIIPNAMAGHSVGEYVAACLAGVMDFKTGLHIIQLRAQLMERTEPGNMMAVQLAEDDLLKLVSKETISIAACNSPSNTVISGTPSIINQLEKKLTAQKIGFKRLNTSHAFHSTLMEPILEDFAREIEKINFNHPSIPFLSNVSGEWAQDHEVITPKYWIEHIKSTVRFSENIERLLDDNFNVFLEIGPSNTLTTFTKEISKNKPGLLILNINNRLSNAHSNSVQFLILLAELWLFGVKIDWNNFNKNHKRSRVPLPTYPFNRQRFWISPSLSAGSSLDYEKQPYKQWFYEISWKRHSFNDIENPTITKLKYVWIILTDKFGVSDLIQDFLIKNNQLVFRIAQDKKFAHLSAYDYKIDITNKEHYQLVIQSILSQTNLPLHIIDLLPLTPPHNEYIYDEIKIKNDIDHCFYSPLFLVQALIENHYTNPVHITLIGNEIFSVLDEPVSPVKSTLTGPCRIIPLEHAHIKIKIIDISLSDISSKISLNLAQNIISDTMNIDTKENIIAYRKNYRWIQGFSNITLQTRENITLRENSIFLLTGGLGGISLTLANHIAHHAKNPIFILISRTSFPIKKRWEEWLNNHATDDPTSKKILKLQTIENLGGQTVIHQANIANKTAFAPIIAAIKEQFGPINGVIHSAGTPGGGLSQFKTKEMAAKVFESKIYGTYLLCSLLKNEPLDFFILCSSISSVVGEASQIDYCSANACLDAFPYSGLFNQYNTLFTAINWNTWQDIGMAVETERPSDISYFDRNNDINPDEGAQIFFDTLNNHLKQVIVSTMPLEGFINQMSLHASGDAIVTDLIERHTILPDEHSYKPPKNDTESSLVRIWQEIFSLDKIGIQDDFFMLGGHSLTALQLLSKIERQFKVPISVSTFLESATTIEKLATVILSNCKTTKKSSSIVIPVRSQGTHAPLFCFHPVAGTIFCYSSLSKYLAYNAPIYGIQDPSIAHGKLLFNSLEDMATFYINEIKKIQPHGPYYLAGLSFGATLSAEVARQFRLAGETTKMLLFFDGWAKFSTTHNIESIFKPAIEQLYGNRADSEKLSNLAWERMLLLLNYEIKPIQETVSLFKAQTLLPEYINIDDPYNYWKTHVIGKLNLYKVPGNHETILDEPNIKTLAVLIDKIFLDSED